MLLLILFVVRLGQTTRDIVAIVPQARTHARDPRNISVKANPSC